MQSSGDVATPYRRLIRTATKGVCCRWRTEGRGQTDDAHNDTSPLILLACVGCLELLRQPPDADVTVPGVVFQEILAGERFDPNVRVIRPASGTWLRIASVPQPTPGLDPNRIDAGELAVLSLALENPRAVVVLDDRAARAEAIRRNIPLPGTVGIWPRAKEQGRTAAIRPTLDAVRQDGLYLTDRLSRIVLRLVGE